MPSFFQKTRKAMDRLKSQLPLTSGSLGFVSLGLILIFLHGTITLFSPLVAYDIFPSLTPILIYVYLGIISGAAIMMLPTFIRHCNKQVNGARSAIIFMVGTGVILRLMMFSSTPILEDDWTRYLWEGAVGNANISPYDHTPADGFHVDKFGRKLFPSKNSDINSLRQLSIKNNNYAYEVAYPYLTTIYPGGAQAAFRLANSVSPFSLTSWRSVLFVADCITISLLILLLSEWNVSTLWAAIYWWNPVVILEGFNSAHMDILLAPPLLASLYAVNKMRPTLAGGFLGIAIATKIWPLMLAPLYLSSMTGQKITTASMKNNLFAMMKYGFSVGIISIILLFPLITQAFQPESGLGAYTSEWRKNNLLFSIILKLVSLFSDNFDVITRTLVAIITIIITAIISLRLSSVKKIPLAITTTTACLFFLAPAGYPWYAIWFLPFLCFSPIRGLLLLSATLPLYYLRFPLYEMDLDWVFNFIIAPIEFGIPILVLIFDNTRKLRMQVP